MVCFQNNMYDRITRMYCEVDVCRRGTKTDQLQTQLQEMQVKNSSVVTSFEHHCE
jgi:hypothetical protein